MATKIQTTIAVLALMVGFGPILAENTPDPEPTPEPVERRTNLHTSQVVGQYRPGAPSRQSVECTLSDAGIMVITMRVPEGEAELTVTDGFDTIIEWFDTSAPYTTILPDGTATYSVSVTTAQGHTYSGTI